MGRKVARRIYAWLAAGLIFLLCGDEALASSLAGKWSGTLSAMDHSAPASATFTKSGKYSIAAHGITSSGDYRCSDDSIILTPSVPPGFTTTVMSLSLKGNRCTISGSVIGIYGTLTLKRKSSPTTGNKKEDKQDTVKPSAAEGAFDSVDTLQRLSGRWLGEGDGRLCQLTFYGDGWAKLTAWDVGADASGAELLAEGYSEMTAEAIVIHPEIEAIGGALAPAGLVISLPYTLDGEDFSICIQDIWFDMMFSSAPEEKYDIHPGGADGNHQTQGE